jgi:hypothetical protein
VKRQLNLYGFKVKWLALTLLAKQISEISVFMFSQSFVLYNPSPGHMTNVLIESAWLENCYLFSSNSLQQYLYIYSVTNFRLIMINNK